jgi:hypothetical protein
MMAQRSAVVDFLIIEEYLLEGFPGSISWKNDVIIL